MLKVVLVDDGKPTLDELEYTLKSNKSIEISGVFTDLGAALRHIEAHKPDIVFLDVQMSKINGFNAAREIIRISNKASIIFVTAYSEYAIDAFEINSLDYVLKPVSKEGLELVVSKVISRRGQDTDMRCRISRVEKLIKLSPERIIVWVDSEIFFLRPKQILYLTLESKSIVVVNRQGRYVTRGDMDDWEEKLRGKSFFRCHRSYLVNLYNIVKISPSLGENSYDIEIDGLKERIPLSRHRVKEFMKIMGS